MSYIFCNHCQSEFKVSQEEGFVPCPDCGQEFQLGNKREIEMDSFKGDQQESNLEKDRL